MIKADSEKRAVAFSNLGRRMSAARTARDAARILAETADELLGWDACLLDLCTPDHASVEPVFCMDVINGKREEVACTPGSTGPLAHLTIHEGARLYNRSSSSAPPGARAFGDTTRRSECLMFVPVRKDQEVIGVFSVQSYRPRAYKVKDLETLQALADHCGGALERIRAEQEIRRLNIELDQRVKARTEQLEAINRELEAFSYSVSHDLRAPLRSIRGFSDVLLERYSTKLDDNGKEFLRRVCESSRQMDRLIDDLLSLSRVTRCEMQVEKVDLSAMASELVEGLHRNEPARAVNVAIAEGLKTDGDSRLLRVALGNLLDNAWKFTSRQNPARIEFGALAEPEPVFFVRDNGAGFDMTYSDRLFGAFQRLHTTAEFPGSGVGLATVRRIINRHGGRTWAEGVVGKGATFYFTTRLLGRSAA